MNKPNKSKPNKSKPNKIIITVVLLTLAVLSVIKVFDQYGEKYTEEGFQRSLSTFAIAKGLNGAISIVQGTEVALEPAGVGLTLTPGQILDPANDLVERFSWVMLLSATSLGIQSILLDIFSSPVFSYSVALILVFITLYIWGEKYKTVNLQNVIYRIAALVIILRFFIPVMAISSDGLYSVFLETKYIESTQKLEETDEAITKLSKESDVPSADTGDMSWYESLSSRISSAFDSLSVDKRVEQLKIEAENLTNHVISLIVVFTIQTIIFPLLFLWSALKLIKTSLSVRFME